MSAQPTDGHTSNAGGPRRPDLPLAGMRVLEVSSFVAAPLGGMTLAQLGADVVRVDPLGGAPDHSRWPLAPSGTSPYWAGRNKGKRSVTVDLCSPEGPELVTRLVTESGADGGIVLTNAVGRGWLEYDALGRRHPGGGLHGQRRRRVPHGRRPGGARRPGEPRASRRGHRPRAVRRPRHPVRRPPPPDHARDIGTRDGGRVMVCALTKRHWADLLTATGPRDGVSALESSVGADFSSEDDRFEYREVLAGTPVAAT